MKSNWERLPFVDVIADESGGNIKTLQSEFLPNGRFAVVDQGKELISGYLDNEPCLCKSLLPVIVFGDHTRCLKFIDFPFCMGADGVKILRPKVDADVKYLYYYLRQLNLPNAGYDRHFKYLKRSDILLPPSEEQKRIAQILDLTQSLISKRKEAIAKLDTLIQSIFLEMFGDPVKNLKQWKRLPFSELLENIDSGWSPVCLDRPVSGEEWGVLKLGAVTWCEYNPSENKAIPIDIKPKPELEVKAGDILFTRKNTYELVAACVLVRETPPRLMMPDLIFRFRLRSDSDIDSCFLHQLLIYPTKRINIQKLAGGSSGSMPNISKAKLQTISIEIPPLPLQKEFTQRVEAVEKLKATHRASLSQLEALFASLQHRAFRGEL